MASGILSSSSSFSFCSSLPSVMETGNPGPSIVAARVAARQRVPPSPAPAVAEPATRGRGRGEAMGEAGALGEGEDGAARQPRLRQQLLQWRAMLGMTLASSSSGCAGRLVVVAAVLLVTPALGAVFTIRRALHAAPCTGPEAPEDLDGEKATLHQLKMESEPLRQAVDMSKRLPSPTKIHHVRGGEVDADPRATDPAAPHVQPQ